MISGRAEPSLLTDQVYAMIRAAILNGEMPAGTRLRVRDLAERVGTSVMPVRSFAASRKRDSLNGRPTRAR